MAEFPCHQCEYPLHAPPGVMVVCPECGSGQSFEREAAKPTLLGPILVVALLAQAPYPMLWVSLGLLGQRARQEAPLLIGICFFISLMLAAIGTRLLKTRRANRATLTIGSITASAALAGILSFFSFFVAAVIEGMDC